MGTQIRKLMIAFLAVNVPFTIMNSVSETNSNLYDLLDEELRSKAKKAPNKKFWLELKEFKHSTQQNPPEVQAEMKTRGFPQEKDWLLEDYYGGYDDSNGRRLPWKKNDTIPKIIYKLYISNTGKFEKIFNVSSPDSKTKSLQNAHESWEQRNPGYQIRYFNLFSMRGYLQKYFHPIFLRAFDCIEAYACKTDLFRYLVVYRDGGWLSDWKQVCLLDGLLDKLAQNTTWFDTADFGPHGFCHQNAFFGGSPRHPVLVETIKIVMNNVQTKHYGPNPLYIAGPCVLSEGYKKAKKKGFGNTKFGVYRKGMEAGYYTYKDESSSHPNVSLFDGQSSSSRRQISVFDGEYPLIEHKCKGCGESQNWKSGNNYNNKYFIREAYCSEAPSLFDPRMS